MINTVTLEVSEYNKLLEKVNYIDNLQKLDDKIVLIDTSYTFLGGIPKIITENKDEIIQDVVKRIKVLEENQKQLFEIAKKFKQEKQEKEENKKLKWYQKL